MKADVHRHLGGSFPLEFIWKLVQKHRLKVESFDTLKRRMTFQSGDQGNFQLFLKKFNILQNIPWSMADVEEGVIETVNSIANEHIQYCELKLSLNKYGAQQWLEAAQVICRAIKETAQTRQITVKPVLALKYESSRESQRAISSAVLRHSICDEFIALDLVGDERFFDDDFYRPICDDWLSAGKVLMAHVGESQSGRNVLKAIKLGITRIGHGIKALRYPDIIREANDRGICFDLALSSNLATGIVKSIDSHPIKQMLAQGCECTLGTDDPTIFDTDLDREYWLAGQAGLTSHQIEILKSNAAERVMSVALDHYCS